MNYLATIKNALVIVAILLLNPLVIVGHTSAMPATLHDTHNSSQRQASQTPSCIALCTTATLKDEETKLVLDEQDDEPIPPKNLPYYALFGSSFIPKKLTNSYVQQLVLRPPDLVKLYSNYRF